MKEKLCLLFLCALLVCVPAFAFAQTLNGCAFVDDNQNAVADQGEQLISGVPLMLEKQTDQGWEPAGQTTTDPYGMYTFDQLTDGDYRVLCNLNGQALYVSSIADSTLYEDGSAVWAFSAEQLPMTADIGLQPSASLTVETIGDSDGNGQRGKYERDLAGITVEVLSGDQVIARGTTPKKGTLTLTFAPGEHVLRYTLPAGYGYVSLAQGTSVAEMPPALFSAGSQTHTTVCARTVGSFSGKAFEDMNNSGVMDEGEPGVPGVTVYLSGERTGTKRTLTTDETGMYFFDFLPDDLYTVTADLPNGMLYARYSQTGGDLRSIFTGSNISRSFSVKSTSSVVNKNIGVVQKGAIIGTAFFDLNYDGVWDEGEPGYAGVTVEAIKISNGDSMGKCVTGEDGSFRLENLRGGDYRLRAILPDDGSVFSVTIDGNADQGNLFVQRPNRRENSIQPLTIESGAEANALIGVAMGAKVSGVVFQDADYNGSKNGKEKALSGIKVRLVNEKDELIATATTDAKGSYTLSGIMPGTYTVQVQRKDNFGFTRLRPAEKGGSHMTALVGDWGVSQPMTIAMADVITDVNAGMLLSATVSGSFFHDLNDNGLWDEGEAGMLSAQVRLLSEDGEIDLYQTPAEDGSYFFDGVMPGKYTITYMLPPHCEMARTAKDGNTVAHDGQQTTTKAFSVAMGDAVQRPLAGAVTLGNFEGIAFGDTNGNGVLDASESPLAGVTVALSAADFEKEIITAIDGQFSITALRPGDYTLSMTLPDGYIFSHEINEDLVLDNAAAQTLPCSWRSLTDRADKFIGAVMPSTISGEIWMDENQDGAQAASEWIMEGVSLSLIDASTGLKVDTVLSDSEGFVFENVRPGVYTVQFELPEQADTANAPASTFYQKGTAMVQTGIAISEGVQLTGLNTGLVSRTSIGGTAWLDENGQRAPVSGLTVMLLENGQVRETAVTGEDGGYRFDGLWPGEYTISAALPSGMIFVRADDPDYQDDPTAIAASSGDTGSSQPLHLLMAQHQLGRNILFIKPAKVGDLAWLDENANGLVDGREHRLSGIQVRLIQNGSTIYETETNAYGYYLFDNVYPGEYVLQASTHAQLAPTVSVPELQIISSCLTSGTGESAQSDAFRVESGMNHFNLDLGYVLEAGQILPSDALADAPTRDWTILNTPKE